jgi:hypothetical protein
LYRHFGVDMRRRLLASILKMKPFSEGENISPSFGTEKNPEPFYEVSISVCQLRKSINSSVLVVGTHFNRSFTILAK